MNRMTESDLLRLSMILENQGNTTRNKYICKLAECVIFDSSKEELTATEIYSEISNRFQLEFDVLEIKNALVAKGKGRIAKVDDKYKLQPKVITQLASVTSFEDKLEKYIEIYIKQKNPNTEKNELLSLIQKHLYYCFNSNAKNLTSIIGCISTIHIDEAILNDYKIEPEEAEIINGFIEWDNVEKDELFYNIVASCYEYCLITANKNPSISKSIFKSKKFYLDTNMIFRMAGINKDERQIVVKNFVKKCNEVGISLCYTNYVLDELFRVIDKEIDFIRKSLTNGQAPINEKLIGSISAGFEPNDFYVMYYNWCKQPQNKYNDYQSFRSYLCKIVDSVIKDFEYVNAPNYQTINKTTFNDLFKNLKEYKTEKRPYRKTTNESVKTDVNQMLHIEAIRPQNAKSLWEMNEYLVSADQLFVTWADSNCSGVPIVVIPSVWLSLILKVSGRASDDDYKSFCMFMTLRQHYNDEDKININPIELLSRISEKTINVNIKENIITEIISNRSKYSFDTPEDYGISVDKAFDVVLSKEKGLYKEELERAVLQEKEKTKAAFDEYEEQLSNRKTKEEYAKEYANKIANSKVNWFAEHRNVLIILKVILAIILLCPIVLACVNVGPFRGFATDIVFGESVSEKIFSVLFYAFEFAIVGMFKLVNETWEYLSSDKRKNKLYKKFFNKQIEIMNN